MEEWQKILDEFYDIVVVSKNSTIIKNGVYNHTENCYMDNLVRRIGKGEKEFFIDSTDLTYASIYEYLGYKNKEEYDSYENKN